MKCVITFSQELPDATQEEVREWAEYILGIRAGISGDNPLIDIDPATKNVKISQV